VVRLLRELVSINSVNPAYPGGVGEAEVARYVEAWARVGGFSVERQSVAPGRDNVLATLDVAGATETLVFEAHMDTVALAPMGDGALRPSIRDGRLYGRGACDTKGSLAAMMVAMERLRDRRADLRVNVALLAVVDEEHAFTGVVRFIDSDSPVSAAVVGEPTELRLVIAHKGCIRGDIVTVGKAAHSSEPGSGVSAIDAMADVLVELRMLDGAFADRRHPLVGAPTFSIGLIDGGTGVNVVPERCTVSYDRRTLPAEKQDEALAELDALLDRVRVHRPDVRIERPDPRLVDDGLDTDPDAALVRAAQVASRGARLDAEPIGVPYGTDASKLHVRRGVPAIVFGPGSIGTAHGADEFVPLAELETAVDVYEGIAMHLGRQP
jgi:acetylornithine deacetylase